MNCGCYKNSRDESELKRMKRYWLFILFCVAVAGGLHAGGAVAAAEQVSSGEREDRLTADGPEILTALVGANQVADISLQQSAPSGIYSSLRRYPQSRIGMENMPDALSGNESRLSVSRYRFLEEGASCGSITVRRQTGYYLYQLCRLII